MSDTWDRTGSGALLSLIIPETGVIRGSYSNSVSPLGITITTPVASPRTSIAYTHRGFLAPREPGQTSLDNFCGDLEKSGY